MIELTDFNFDEIVKIVTEEYNQPAYRAKQLYAGLSRFQSFDEMSDLPKNFREQLAQKYSPTALAIEKKFISVDGTEKYLYRLNDGNIIEGAFMKQHYGNTLCISTQVGCRMGCAFCASGIGGLVRNLTAGEILSQALAVNRDQGGTVNDRAITNIVLMGSGEPLDNYDEVTKFLRLVTSEKSLNISERNISLSTCGLVDKVYRLADDGFSVTLTFSLHASNDESRRRIMPVANKYLIKDIIDSAKYYFEKTGRRVIFEYTMIKGENINHFDAVRLSQIMKGFPTHINLIPLNPVKEKNITGCTKVEGERFMKKLNEMGVSASIRKSKGADIGGACGQLRRSYVGGGNNE
ncbi:MAG: 23S rRNA (adenine(2503)-C(2))-methyltransferase RlmN [Clostridia bacterium]|nr:23S rRNA (adenine(2503)-C(2))-methyltransferase RlmN [Clostridia bacterium]